MNTNILIPGRRIGVAVQTALAAGAIAVGLIGITAPTANAQTFQQSCVQNPGAYAAGATRGEWGFERHGNDRHQFCATYDRNGNKLGVAWAYPDYGWYLKHADVPKAPPLSVQK